MSALRTVIILSLLGAVALPATACSSDPAKTTIELCGDLDVPEDIEAVRVEIRDQNGKTLRQGVRELWSCPGPSLKRLPQKLEFAAVSGDVFVVVQGLKDSAPVTSAELRTKLSGNDQATVSLTKSCMGARCAAGETCVDGQCELIALAARAVSRCPSDRPQRADAGDVGDAGDAGDADVAVVTDTGVASDAGDAGDAGVSAPNPYAYLCPQDDVGVADAGDAGDVSDADAAQGGSQ